MIRSPRSFRRIWGTSSTTRLLMAFWNRPASSDAGVTSCAGLRFWCISDPGSEHSAPDPAQARVGRAPRVTSSIDPLMNSFLSRQNDCIIPVHHADLGCPLCPRWQTSAAPCLRSGGCAFGPCGVIAARTPELPVLKPPPRGFPAGAPCASSRQTGSRQVLG